MPKFLTGQAGTGKSRTILDMADAELTSSTGVSAINLGTKTIHSHLGFYNAHDLKFKIERHMVQKRLDRMRQENCLPETLVVDEVSMLSAEVLDLVDRVVKPYTKLMLVGDFCQLPPVSGEFAFKAKCWPSYEKDTVRLTKVWRQDNPDFLSALNHARAGDGPSAVALLRSSAVDVKFSNAIDYDWPGVILVPTNREADVINQRQFNQLIGEVATYKPSPSGTQSPDWKQILPVDLKVGARVMLTANDVPEFAYANGDTGVVMGMGKTWVSVLLDRTGNCETVAFVIRTHKELHRVVGKIEFMPLRLAWASTVHKCQGLTLDHVQVDCRHEFAASPALMYVALSRVRSPRGLRVVGHPQTLASNIQVHQEAKQWL